MQAEERNSLVRDLSAVMEKASDSFEKFNENIQRIADDQAKIDRTIQSLVEEIKAMVCTNCFWYRGLFSRHVFFLNQSKFEPFFLFVFQRQQQLLQFAVAGGF